ncbi:MAG: DNA-directed RNA polymerase subunit beta [Desulfobulbaceae bacterium]|uniref:DNA-directed RNA polymerase subunit beta n=1 Tax=Candidatus Desulfobia pelagia TaxID=2841692 RepID=A0A8J6TGA3_9BACT|nr:DNA-directed RNA polymerase subunit beta [Candidatus Desulfobia pelagia]
MKLNKRVRKSFAKIGEVVEKPHLIAMQQQSFEKFLQMDVDPDEREDIGLQGVYKSVFPIQDFNGVCSMEFVNYTFGEPKYTVEECVERGMSYEVPIKLTVRLVTYDVDPETEVQSIRDIKEQSVYLGSIALMTKTGVFVINGTERVIVSQLQRSPGLFYAHDSGKTHSTGKLLYSARIIPVRGSWVDLEFDSKDVLYVRIDRRRKFPVSTLLKALGYSGKELLRYFYDTEKISFGKNSIRKTVDPQLMVGHRIQHDLIDPENGEILVKKNRKISKTAAAKLHKAGIDTFDVELENLIGAIVLDDIVDPATGEVIVPGNGELTEEAIEAMTAAGVVTLEVLHIDGIKVSDSFRKTLALDKATTSEEALLELYRRLRPSSPPTLEVADKFFENLFFNPETYDLSVVGRFKINAKLGLDTDIEVRTLTKEDIMGAVRYLLRLKDAQGPVDDIDHLGNRRVRTVGELVENQYRMGLVRMERAIRERMSLQEVETLMPHDLINPKPITAAIKEFFGTSQLSQFMDQTNPLSEVTHKRRLSALGPGGLSRERAGFEVRDVHPTHYGRICPVETPEGPNIGLIVSLASYAKVNEYGFIETPLRKVVDRKLTDEVVYVSALKEKNEIVVPATAEVDADGKLVADNLIARQEGEVVFVKTDDITSMDISPNQLVSVAASMIPFLDNDDANRALMGSNMQRQGVPLLRTEAPVIGTGMEATVARDSGVCLLAGGDGVIEEVDANRVVVRYDKAGIDGFDTGIGVYRLDKYRKSNQSTCFTQAPVVLPGQRVSKDDILADGPAVEKGELALGKNVTIAFMPWRGYNFEDSILVSEKLLKKDTYTSLHIEVFETVARDTKLGKEEITRDIPNVSEESLRNLDDSGVVRIGAEVRAGDTLVGKVTPKGETQLSPEEKLLRAIFGEKAGDVKDTSLRVPPGVEGVIIDAKVFSRKGVDKDERALAIEEVEIARLQRDLDDEVNCLKKAVRNNLAEILAKEKVNSAVLSKNGTELLEEGGKINLELLEKLPLSSIKRLDYTHREKLEGEVELLYERYDRQVKQVKDRYEVRIKRLRKGDDLPPGVIKMVKIYIATKRKLAVGDKMAGRHGNKGVVSRILPEEDMPYFADGTSVDIVLNPLGVPSRMNVGQVLEVHLGRAAKQLGKQLQELAEKYEIDAVKKKLQKIYSKDEYKRLTDGLSDDEILQVARNMEVGVHMATPVFDGAHEGEIRNLLVEAGCEEVGQTTLYDGLSGEKFENPVTVGTMYFLKLHHLVDDKIHARSTGPYSLVTQQPLGGKAQFGGQRLGEMEVWAMEAYGAAYTLQEFLTVKSDDVAGRTKMYEKIVKGNNFLTAGLPESFHVLIKELQGLCLDMELLDE